MQRLVAREILSGLDRIGQGHTRLRRRLVPLRLRRRDLCVRLLELRFGLPHVRLALRNAGLGAGRLDHGEQTPGLDMAVVEIGYLLQRARDLRRDPHDMRIDERVIGRFVLPCVEVIEHRADHDRCDHDREDDPEQRLAEDRRLLVLLVVVLLVVVLGVVVPLLAALILVPGLVAGRGLAAARPP